MSVIILNRRALNRATLARQMLLRREQATPVEAIERLCGMQAQLARPPFIGLWSRLESLTRRDLIEAIDNRDVLRGTLMRGTLHLMSRRDFIAFRAAIQPVLSAALLGVFRDRANGADRDAILAAARERFAGDACTFDALRDFLSERFPGVDERLMGYTVRMHLPLVQTPAPGATWAYPAAADFTVAESWLGEPLSDDATPHALVLRYLAAFGPASVEDFQTWSGLKSARPVFDALRPALQTFHTERRKELFDLPDAPRPSEDTDAPVRFLPDFDNLLLAHADRERIIASEHRSLVCTKNLRILPTFLVDGFATGLWTTERKRKEATLVIQPFGALAKGRRQELFEEGERLLRFVEEDAQRFTVRTADKG